ncbi:MAG: hypothetical protein FWE82_04725 [Defluviitaleaceae bacterium]|nr:hypothetical protein [Defluviitaleaceae bacterium]
MNGKEIIDSLLKNKKAPRMGLYDSPWGETLGAWVKEGYPEENGKPENPADHFFFDMECAGGWFDWAPKQGVHELLQETDEWVVTRNGAGAAFKNWKHKAGTPEHIDFHMSTREIWESDYREHVKPCESRIGAGNKDALIAVRKKNIWAYYGGLGLWEYMRSSMGDLVMFEALAADQEWVLDFNKVYTDFYKGMYGLLFEKAGLPDGIWVCDDLGYKNGLYCSPAALEKLFAPFYKEIVDFFKSFGLPVVFHCCGGIEEAVPILIDCGFDAINPLERKAGCDPLRLAKKYGDRLAFIGGMDAVTLESGDRARMFREADALIDGMKDLGAAYIFASDHSLSPLVRYSDFMAVVERFWSKATY